MVHRKNLPATACVANLEADGRLNAPSALRNAEPIVELVREIAIKSGNALEIASGSGQHVVKLAAVQQTYLLILNGGIAVSEQMIVADRTAFESRAPTFTPDELLTELGAQLIRFQDQPNGTVSGKTTHGDNDDMAMCLLLGVYWRICVVSSTTLGTSE